MKLALPAWAREAAFAVRTPETAAQLGLALLLAGHFLGWSALLSPGGSGDPPSSLLALAGLLVVLVVAALLVVGRTKAALVLLALLWLRPWDFASSPLATHSAIQWWSLSVVHIDPPRGAPLLDMAIAVLGCVAIAALGRLRGEARAAREQGAEAKERLAASAKATLAVLALAGGFLLLLWGVAG